MEYHASMPAPLCTLLCERGRTRGRRCALDKRGICSYRPDLRVGKPVVILSGGEPLMRKDIFAIARYGTKKGLKMAMGTSGVLIDETVAREMRNSGIRRVAISIDSADPGSA